MTPRALVEARGVTLRRGERVLLEDVTVGLAAGERWVLWGANGAGKSSLARLLAGLEAPSAGSVLFAAGVDAPLPLLVPDPDAQLAAASVRDEIALGARRPGEPRLDRAGRGPAAARIDAALAEYRLGALARRNPHALSGGEKRRLAIAALSVLDSPVLLLDEPELHLDPPSWRETCAHLDAWLAGGERAVLEISRDPARLAGAAGLAVLHDGRLIAAGPPERVREALAGRPELALPWPGETPAAAPAPPPPGDAVLRAEGLRLDRPSGGTPVLAGLDLTLHAGERVLLVGDNGSGKSVLLLLLAGLADPDAGRLWRAPDSGEPALAFQEPERVCFAERVDAEVAFGLERRLGLRGAALAARVETALAAVGLPAATFASRDPFRLSTGEQRRLALASILALEPPLLLLDEPAAALDPAGRAALLAAVDAWPGALLWADCRPEAGEGVRWHRRLRLADGHLSEE
ncbi:MAG: ATP-binding cassette domain-containing protein [Candidatus Krumholzibacteriia bacterium]